MTQTMGSDIAKRFGDAHEVSNVAEGEPADEFGMDSHNNAVGRALANNSAFKGVGAAAAAQAALASGCLKTLK